MTMMNKSFRLATVLAILSALLMAGEAVFADCSCSTPEEHWAQSCQGNPPVCWPQCVPPWPYATYSPCNARCDGTCIPGTTPDADGDNVPDGCDLCPDTLACVNNVDHDGCPTDADTDGDAVLDGCDDCPTGTDCTSGSSLVYIVALQRLTGFFDETEQGLRPRCAWDTGSPADDQVFEVGHVLAWEIRVLVAGAHSAPGDSSDGLAVIGAAAMMFSLELRTAEGQLVNLPGSVWLPGAKNSVEHAYYRPIFDLDANGYRTGSVHSLLSAEGPGLTGTQYPSVSGNPAGATTEPGVLARMGAAYSSYDTLQQAAGVGLTVGVQGCRSLGAVPLFEGQIATSSLSPGVYVLKCVPHVGNVLLDPSTCGTSAEGTTVRAANQVLGDTLVFELRP